MQLRFWRRRRAETATVREAGRATVVTVGSSVVQRRQSTISLRLRLAVVLDSGVSYEVTSAWTIDAGQLTAVHPGASFPVDVVTTRPAEVHPRDGRMSWDRLRTPRDVKYRDTTPR